MDNSQLYALLHKVMIVVGFILAFQVVLAVSVAGYVAKKELGKFRISRFSTQGRSGFSTTQGLARYDEAVRVKARKVGLPAYSGGDLGRGP